MDFIKIIIKKYFFLPMVFFQFSSVSFAQNLTFTELLAIQKMTYNQTESYLNNKTGWNYYTAGVDNDFYNYNFYEWSYKKNSNNNTAESWIKLCQLKGYENAIIYYTTKVPFDDMLLNVSNDKEHWKYEKTFTDDNGNQNKVYKFSKYYLVFISSASRQIRLYNTLEIEKQKATILKEKATADSLAFVEKVRADSIAAVENYIRLKEKQRKDSIYAVLKAKRISDSLEIVRIEKAKVRKEVLSKTYDLKDYDVYKKIYANITSAFSIYLNSLSDTSEVISNYKYNISSDTIGNIKISAQRIEGRELPESVIANIRGKSILYVGPKVKDLYVNSVGEVNVSLSLHHGFTKIKKKGSNLIYLTGGPSYNVKNYLSSSLKVSDNGIYKYSYSEQSVDNSNICKATLKKYKKHTFGGTVFRVIGTILLIPLALLAYA